MKKFLRFMPLMLVALLSVALFSCSDDDEPVAPSNLPEQAKTFLAAYYPNVEIVSVVKDNNEYDVILANGHSVDFDKAGLWQEVSAPMGQTVPKGFYPAAIDAYVDALGAPVVGINDITRIKGGYEVDLVNGLELFFNTEGAFVGYDAD